MAMRHRGGLRQNAPGKIRRTSAKQRKRRRRSELELQALISKYRKGVGRKLESRYKGDLEKSKG